METTKIITDICNCIDNERLIKKVGILDGLILEKVNLAIKVSLGL